MLKHPRFTSSLVFNPTTTNKTTWIRYYSSSSTTTNNNTNKSTRFLTSTSTPNNNNKSTTNRSVIVQKFGGTSLGTSEKLDKSCKIMTQFHNKSTETVVAVVSALSSETKSEGTTSRLLAAAEAAVQQKDFNMYLDRIEDTHMDALYGILKGRAGREETRAFVTKELHAVREFCTALGVIREISPRSHDMIIGCGERLSAGLIAGVLRDQGIDARYVNLSSVFTDLNTQKNGYQQIARDTLGKLLRPMVDEGALPVVSGFFGHIRGGIIHGVGRGYTDLTAALCAGALGARELQVWKESDGVFTGNPTKIQEATLVNHITPAEAAELTSFGNEVLHPFTMQCAIETNVPIRILNTFKPTGAGTVIIDQATSDAKSTTAPTRNAAKHGIVAVCSKKNVTILNVVGNGVLEASELFTALFNTFTKHGVRADLVTSSISQISVTLHETTTPAQISALVKDLEEFSLPRVKGSRAIVSCVGEGMAHQVGLAAKVFGCLADSGISIEMLAQGASEINISSVIDQKDEEKAIKAIHKKFLQQQ
jgi:aspartate kinase